MNQSHFGAPLPALYNAMESWVVLAAGTFITACYTRNFLPLDLLRAPLVFYGAIQTRNGARIAHAVVPKWLPINEVIFEIEGGSVLTRVKDFPLGKQSQANDDATVRFLLDVTKASVPEHINTCSLTYFPWFRFLTEPVGFNATGRVSAYVSDAFRFLLAQRGQAAHVSMKGDVCTLTTDISLQIDVAGMSDLRSICIGTSDARSLFDLAGRKIVIDRRMFPAAFRAGCDVLDTGDRLINMHVVRADETVSLRYTEESSHV